MPVDYPFLIQVKIFLASTFGLTADALHIYIGVLCLLVGLARTRFESYSFWLLIPGIVVASLGEVGDLFLDWQGTGNLRIFESFHDIFNTNFLPAVLLATLRLVVWVQSKRTEVRG